MDSTKTRPKNIWQEKLKETANQLKKRCIRAPQSHSVSIGCAIAGDRSVEGHSKHNLSTLPLKERLVAFMVGAHMSIETNWVRNIQTLNFPRVTLGQPVVRALHLLVVSDKLFEDAEAVSDSVSAENPGKLLNIH